MLVHRDGKMLPDITGSARVNRLQILVSGLQVEQLFGVQNLANGIGEAMLLLQLSKSGGLKSG